MKQDINKWRLPSRYVPLKSITIGKLHITSGRKIITTDNWGRDMCTGSLVVSEEGHSGVLDNWVFFHAILFNAPFIVQTFQSFGNGVGDFKVKEAMNSKNSIETPINYDDIGKFVYGDSCDDTFSYEDAYTNYLKLKDGLLPAIKNFLLAYDLGFHKVLRYIDTSYWQIVMYISAMESLLPPPVFCKGRCDSCGKEVSHPINSTDQEFKKALFSRIKSKITENQYKSIFYEAKRRIRNDTVHNGLFPSTTNISLSEGITSYTTVDALAGYKSDRYSLELIVEQLHYICRYMILNQVIKKDIFPPLKGFEVHSVTIKPNL